MIAPLQIPDNGPDFNVRLAQAIVAAYGGSYKKAETTNSVYIQLPGAPLEIRLSDHRKYGSIYPTHIQPARYPRRSRYGLTLADVIERAVRAAYAGARRFRDVPRAEAESPKGEA